MGNYSFLLFQLLFMSPPWWGSDLCITPRQDPPWFLQRLFIPPWALRHKAVMRLPEAGMVPCRISSASSEVRLVGRLAEGGGGWGAEARILLWWRRNYARSIFKPTGVCNTTFGAVTFKCAFKRKQTEPGKQAKKEKHLPLTPTTTET